MDMFAESWRLWLVLTIVCGGYCLYMEKEKKQSEKDGTEDAIIRKTKRSINIAFIIEIVFLLLFLGSVVANRILQATGANVFLIK